MPTHPGNIDPVLVLSHLRLPGGIRPTVRSSYYRVPVLYPLMRLAGALEVPDLQEHSHDARARALSMIEAVVAGLARGESFLLYPSGHVQRRGVEQIGAARAAFEILRRCPQVNVVLVRTRGLFGSMFGYAQTARAANLGRCVLRSLGWLMAGLLIFMPRREVTMIVEVIDRRHLPDSSREALNRYLEDWYNLGGPEAPRYVPYHHLFGPREFLYPEPPRAEAIDFSKIRPATMEAVLAIIEEQLGSPPGSEEKRPETRLDQIGLDSIGRMDVAMKIEDRFGFRSERVADTLGEFYALAEGLLTGSDEEPQPAPETWSRPPTGLLSTDVLGETLLEALVRRALEHLDDVAAADRISGVLTYRKLLVGARLMSTRLGGLAAEAIGVLLPSSVAADLVFFALHQAGKLPVMLNWTTGPANLAHAVQTLEVRWVVTSRRLVDRLGINVPGAQYVFLKDLRSQIGKVEAARALAGTYLFPQRLLRNLPRVRPDRPAVVLFTSGSESTPKAVPLSHRNLIANVRASLAVLGATRDDALLGSLPPFHSFGLTGNLIAPLVAGIRVVHHPDPTDAGGLVRAIAAYRATLMVTTPTFLSYILSAARPEHLDSVRIVVAGAEKCPPAVFDRARQLAPQAEILEGYGITECSPVVSGNRPGHIRPGTVGQPVEGVEICVVDPETRKPLPANATGLLLVRGPSIFEGYLSYEGPNPFVEIAGNKWYVTGDLVRLDEDRFIHFQGRLKRFLKAGGEMISLPALEEPISRLYPATEQGPRVAIEGIETPSGRCIVLFTCADVTLRQANAILTESGLRGVMRIDEVVRLESIPILGTGKTDYKTLRKMVSERVAAIEGEHES